GFQWDLFQQYAAIEDPQFLGGVVTTLEAALPLHSQLHDDSDIIPMMTAEQATAAAGRRWKVCQASPAIVRLQGQTPIAPAELTPVVDPKQLPSFRVMLPRNVLIADKDFVELSVMIRYELCRRYCDNPFYDEAG